MERQDYREETFFLDKLSILVPAAFFRMAAEEVKETFPYVKKPQIVLTDGAKVTFNLSLLGQQLGDEEVKSAAEGVVRQLNQIYPGQVGRKPVFCQNADMPVYRFILFLPGGEEDMFYEIFVFSLDHRFAFGGISYPADDKAEWQDRLCIMLESFRRLS